ncbi:hypothetical protein [Oenococcus sicerae]|uniref:hypothetical protein n=1 Tax=Oenococcus sicerae TaxID=2203724 RepID=UPI0010AF1AE6|nr:hypothetical protein OAL24_00779 [Oenococcus sicerae]
MQKQQHHFSLIKNGIIVSLSSLVFSTGIPSVLNASESIGRNTVLQQANAAETEIPILTLSEQRLFQSIDSTSIDTNQMSKDQLDVFQKYVNKIVDQKDWPTPADEEDAYNTMLSMYNSRSDNYYDAAAATSQLTEEIDHNHESLLGKMTGEKALAAQHGSISVYIAGTAIDIAIAAATGGAGYASLTAIIRAKGRSYVEKKIAPKIVATITKITGQKVTKTVKDKIVSYIGLASAGYAVAKAIDAMDKIKNNGYLELW